MQELPNTVPLPFKKVLILSQYFPPEPGAPQIRLMAMAKELQKMGVDVQVLTGMPNYPTGTIHPDYRGKFFIREQVEGVPVLRVWLYPAAGRKPIRRLLNYFSFTWNAGWVLFFLDKPELIFVEAQPMTLAIPACLYKWLRKIPYVYNTPDLQVEHAQEARWMPVRFLTVCARELETFLMKQAYSVTTVTHAFIEHFSRTRKIDKAHFTFLPNGADTENLKPLLYDAHYAKKMGIATGQKVFTYAGTHAHYQGLDVILDAAKLLQDRKDIVILMVGKGPERARLMERAQKEGINNVLFRDSPFSEMAQLMSITSASLVVLRKQGVSEKMRLSKTIPPLACGVPVIYAGVGESADIIAANGCGLVVEPEEPAALADAIVSLLAHPEESCRMGRRARSLAEQTFSWRLIVAEWARQLSLVGLSQ